jgi:two-component system CheB/CheR fusion protein
VIACDGPTSLTLEWGPSPRDAAPRRSVRILLVDDHRDTLSAMSRLLLKTGHEVTTASTLSAAIALCKSLTFDLLICDIQLPDGDGHELAAVARACGAKAISMTGFVVEDLSPERPGFDGHLMKPVSFELLQSTIARVMEAGGKTA